MASVNDLIKQKKELVDAAAEIRERVYNEQNGEWRGDDEAKFDELTARAESKQREIERLAKLDEMAASFEERKEAKRSASADFGKKTPNFGLQWSPR